MRAPHIAAIMLDEPWVGSCKRFYCVNVFQGGYNLTSLPQSVCQTVQTLLGDPAPLPVNLDGPCQRSVSSSVRFMSQMCVCDFVMKVNYIFLFSAHSSLFTVFDQLIGCTGPASNMQVEHAHHSF